MVDNTRRNDDQMETPVHNQPNLWRVVRRVCIDNAHSTRSQALLSFLEMCVYKIQDGD